MRRNEWQGGEQGIAESAGTLLYGVADGRVADLTTEVTDDVTLRRGNYETDPGRSRAQHAIEEVFTNSPRTLSSSIIPRSDRQQLFRESKRLNSRSQTCSWNNSPDAHAATSTKLMSSVLRRSALFSAKVRSRAALAICCSSEGPSSRARSTSSAERATRISRPGSKK